MTEPTDPLEEQFLEDIAAVDRIDAVKTILEVVCRTTGLGFAAVARVTGERWIACAVRDEIEFGLKPGGELRVATTICKEIRDTGKLVVIDHADEDIVYCKHPTPKLYGFQSYISVPIRLANGEFFGTLCAIDPKPAQVSSPQIVNMFKLFGDLIAFHLQAQERLLHSERELKDERATAEFREQFIAVLGHDLRNPLAAIDAGARAMQLMALDTRASKVVALIRRSGSRMSELINNILDFAQGRLGSGLSISRRVDPALASILEHVISELQSAWPQRAIEYKITVGENVSCDAARIAQLLSNLASNALIHGDPNGAVKVTARSDEAVFELSVSNTGDPIPPHTLAQLFKPFTRTSIQGHQRGLGLGLYIAAEVAKAHGGQIDVKSDATETRFTFHMPIKAPRP
jgi:signal transduction histidine kinase